MPIVARHILDPRLQQDRWDSRKDASTVAQVLALIWLNPWGLVDVEYTSYCLTNWYGIRSCLSHLASHIWQVICSNLWCITSAVQSCQLFTFKTGLSSFKRSLPWDTLDGHRQRFVSLYNDLKKIYEKLASIQYLRGILQVRTLGGGGGVLANFPLLFLRHRSWTSCFSSRLFLSVSPSFSWSCNMLGSHRFFFPSSPLPLWQVVQS